MSKKDIKVPNIGEFKDVEVIEVLIKKGQKIKKNDPLITIESDKSSVEIPSSDDGTIISLNVKIGDKVSEGDKIIEIESEKEIKETSQKEVMLHKERLWAEDLKEAIMQNSRAVVQRHEPVGGSRAMSLMPLLAASHYTGTQDEQPNNPTKMVNLHSSIPQS